MANEKFYLKKDLEQMKLLWHEKITSTTAKELWESLGIESVKSQDFKLVDGDTLEVANCYLVKKNDWSVEVVYNRAGLVIKDSDGKDKLLVQYTLNKNDCIKMDWKEYVIKELGERYIRCSQVEGIDEVTDVLPYSRAIKLLDSWEAELKQCKLRINMGKK